MQIMHALQHVAAQQHQHAQIAYTKPQTTCSTTRLKKTNQSAITLSTHSHVVKTRCVLLVLDYKVTDALVSP
jgi:hypothetical protein